MAETIVKHKSKGHVYQLSGRVVTDSYLLSKRLEVPHSDFARTVDDYLLEKSQVAHATGEISKNKRSQLLKSQPLGTVLQVGEQIFIVSTFKSRGKTFPCWAMNEQAFLKVSTLLQKYEKADQLVDRLISEFHQLRLAAATQSVNKANIQWIEARSQGKIERRVETDAIKGFIAYAIDQGSKSASTYYMNLSRMENKALFLVEQKYPNLREVLNTAQLNTLQTADRAVSKALKDGMDQGLHYKEIYKLAKTKVEMIAEAVGKTPVPKGLSLRESGSNYLGSVA